MADLGCEDAAVRCRAGELEEEGGEGGKENLWFVREERRKGGRELEVGKTRGGERGEGEKGGKGKGRKRTAAITGYGTGGCTRRRRILVKRRMTLEGMRFLAFGIVLI